MDRAGDDDEEVDEITEQEEFPSAPDNINPLTGKPRYSGQPIKPSRPEPTLDQFLAEIFDEQVESSEPGLPPYKWLRDNFKTSSARIRHLHALGAPVKTISKHLGLRYQHVRNVLTVELKRGPNETYNDKDWEAPSISDPSKFK